MVAWWRWSGSCSSLASLLRFQEWPPSFIKVLRVPSSMPALRSCLWLSNSTCSRKLGTGSCWLSEGVLSLHHMELMYRFLWNLCWNYSLGNCSVDENWKLWTICTAAHGVLFSFDVGYFTRGDPPQVESIFGHSGLHANHTVWSSREQPCTWRTIAYMQLKAIEISILAVFEQCQWII